jgi:SAM-dependent methyltransferase
MYPRTTSGEYRHRQRKRKLEIARIVALIAAFGGWNVADADADDEVLEFGCGSGAQIEELQRFGRVTATDVYRSAAFDDLKQVKFVQCGIDATPFDDAQFDLLFSNHVIEHIENYPKAFAEMRRIGKPNCIYAFAVPTNLWLALSIPAGVYDKARKVLGFTPRYSREGGWAEHPAAGAAPGSSGRTFLKRLLPDGHGVETDFGRCYEMFKISAWTKFFESYGFTISSVQPVMLYGPSQFPVIPTMRNLGKFCSSVLFIMKYANPHEAQEKSATAAESTSA